MSDKAINVCYLVPLTGAAPVPTTWDVGAKLYWEFTAKHGGINSRNVALTVLDTKSDTATALAQARECINRKAFTFVTLDRFEVQAAVGNFLNSKGIPNVQVQAPPSAAGPDKTNNFVITIDHRVQGRMIADYFTSGDLKGKKYGVIRENVKDLLPGTNAFKDEVRTRGGSVVCDEPVDGNENNFSSTILKCSRAGAQVVWFYGAPVPLAKLAQQSQAANYHPIWFANTISWAFDDTADLGNKGGALDGARAFSSWVADSSPRANHYKQAMRELHPNEDADDIGLVGWGVGEVLGAALKAAGRNLGYNTFRSAFQSLNITPEVWTPLRFGPGVRYGTVSVIEFRIARPSDDHWTEVGTFRSSF